MPALRAHCLALLLYAVPYALFSFIYTFYFPFYRSHNHAHHFQKHFLPFLRCVFFCFYFCVALPNAHTFIYDIYVYAYAYAFKCRALRLAWITCTHALCLHYPPPPAVLCCVRDLRTPRALCLVCLHMACFVSFRSFPFRSYLTTRTVHHCTGYLGGVVCTTILLPLRRSALCLPYTGLSASLFRLPPTYRALYLPLCMLPDHYLIQHLLLYHYFCCSYQFSMQVSFLIPILLHYCPHTYHHSAYTGLTANYTTASSRNTFTCLFPLQHLID